MTTQAVFDADLARFNAEIERRDAVITTSDGWLGADPAKLPADFVRAYERLLTYGAANGLLRKCENF